MARSRWLQVYKGHSEQDAKDWVARTRQKDKASGLAGIKYSIRKERHAGWNYQGETVYMVYMLAPGVY